MTTLHFPAQRICSINKSDGLILAITGSHIQTLSLESEHSISIWPSDEGHSTSEESDGDDERPHKRVKLDNGDRPRLGREASDGSEVSIEIKVEGRPRQKGERRKPKLPDLSLPHVSHLITTTDGKHAIAITAEDKAVRVFKISRSGRLRQLSSRCMPKKSCAITLSPDEQTILTADKFGDVYAIPLHPDSDYQPTPKPAEVELNFKPSASDLTVHTKGNLAALKQQLTQKQKHPRKEGPAFEYKLLLGHVSLLTDLTTAVGTVDNQSRHFLLTSDRDEHIRVSRGLPQTHIINSYCLGHTEFVSKLLIVPWSPDILIAGNGEPSLRLYNWQSGHQLSRYDILLNSSDEIRKVLPTDRALDQLAVSGIWPVSVADSTSSTGTLHAILVALEALPLLFVLHLDNSTLTHLQTFITPGNVLDVLHLPDRETVAISIDTVHEPGSCRSHRSGSQGLDPIHYLGVSVGIPEDGAGQHVLVMLPCRVETPTMGVDPISVDAFLAKHAEGEKGKGGAERAYSAIGEILYGLENLRKRRGKSAAEEDDEGVEVDDAGAGVGELEGAPAIGT